MEAEASFGAWVRRRRKALDLLQKELAARVGCSVTALQKIERDERRPSRQLAERLADSLGVPAEERAMFLQVARGERMAERLNSASEAVAPPAEAQHSPEPARPELMSPAAPLIGRETELANLALLLRDPSCRLLTLTGPGGIGKTRLALAATQHDAFAQGVAFAALAPLLGRDQVVTAIADALGCVLYGTRDRADQLVQFLRGKALLLVLDNFEHLLADAACVELIGQLLRGTDRLKLLLTSREPLDIQEEWVFDVQGLPTPLSAAPHDLEASSAARLFQQRARQARAGYTLSAEDTAAVVQICQLVGGVPLGIELAATWMRTLACQEIADEIQRNLDFLVTRARDVPERHRSIRAVFDQSWALLTAEEQRVLRRVSVFRGGFTRAAAEEVAGASLALLAALVAKSLLRRMTAGRYDPHELVRQYALDHLSADEREATETQHRHSRYYARLLEQRGAAFKGPDQTAVVAELASELANIRQAWDWACRHQLATELSQAADTLFWLYEAQSNFREGIPLFGQAVESLRVAGSQAGPDAERSHQLALGQALSYQGFFCFRQGQHPLGRELLQRSVALLGVLAEAGAPEARAAVSTAAAFLGIVTYRMGEYAEGRRLLDEGLAIKRALGDRWGTALCLRQLGLAAYSQGEYPEAHRVLSESLALSRAMGNPWSLAFSLNFLSRVAFAQGAYDEAQQLLEEGLALSRTLSDRFNMASAQNGLGMVYRARGHAFDARRSFEESIALWRELGDQDSLAQGLNQLGETLLASGDRSAARDCFMEALAVAREAHVAPVMLDALLGIASLHAAEGAVEAPLELVSHILENSASTQEARGRAEQLRTALEQYLSPQHVERIRSRARARSLSELAAPEHMSRLLAALSRSGEQESPATSRDLVTSLGAAVDEAPPTTTLLTAKLHVPPARSSLVARPRLLAQMQAGLSGKLTLLSAPAGFGKTTLVSTWIAALSSEFSVVSSKSGWQSQPKTQNSRLKIQVAWVSLEAADSAPIRFWSYVIAALDMLHAESGSHALAMLQSPQPPPIEAVLTPLLNALGTLSTDAVLVLDDYHLVDAPAIHSMLAFMLDHLPPRLHVVITTRADPPLPLTQLRASGQLTELRAADLRFTADETAAFLTELMGFALSARDITALEARTEGWIAGLQLAVLAMRDRGDISDFIAAFTGSNRFIVDYLAEEVIARQPLHVRTFLLQTAILDRLCGPLCDAVLGLTNDQRPTTNDPQDSVNDDSPFVVRRSSFVESYSQLILKQLERANLFLVPLDDTRQWYRYHHLFAEVLRVRLQSSASVAEIAALHRNASAWYERHGLSAEAITHALEAHDAERAARLIEPRARLMFIRGEVNPLMSWLAMLPDEILRRRPRLGMNYAWGLLYTGQLLASEQQLQRLEAGLAGHPERPSLLGEIAVIRATIAIVSGDFPRTRAHALEALANLPDDHTSLRGSAHLCLGSAAMEQGDMAGASEHYARSAALFEAADDMPQALLPLRRLAKVHLLQGRLNQLEQIAHSALRLASAWGGRAPLVGTTYVSMGELCYERNDLAAAAQHLTDGLEIIQLGGARDITDTTYLVDGYLALARVKGAQNDTAGALALVDQAEAAWEQLGRVIRARAGNTTGPNDAVANPTASLPAPIQRYAEYIAAYQAHLWLKQGDVEAASLWASRSGLSPDDELAFVHERGHVGLARVLIAREEYAHARSLLERLGQAAEAGGRNGCVIEILTLQALAIHAQGDTPAALAALEQALLVAEPEGHIRIFVDEGQPMAALLGEAMHHGMAPGYVAKLLVAFPSSEFKVLSSEVEDVATQTSNLKPQTSLVEPLTDREFEILRLIAEGYSNQAIADTLIIAVSTVKRHINNIYGKLGVQSRTQALLRAREFQLL